MLLSGVCRPGEGAFVVGCSVTVGKGLVSPGQTDCSSPGRQVVTCHPAFSANSDPEAPVHFPLHDGLLLGVWGAVVCSGNLVPSTSYLTESP